MINSDYAKTITLDQQQKLCGNLRRIPRNNKLIILVSSIDVRVFNKDRGVKNRQKLKIKNRGKYVIP